MRQIIFWLRFDIEPAMAHVADHAHNRYPLRIRFSRIAEGDFFADRVLVGEPFPGEGLIDDGDLRRIRGVPLIKKTPPDQWDFQNLEIVLRHAANLFVRVNFLLHGITALDGERAVAVRSAQGKNRGKGGRFHTRQRQYSPDYFRIKIRDWFAARVFRHR